MNVVDWMSLLATLSVGLFTGAAVYINLVEHPARMECGTSIAMAQFPPSYRRATLMQASLAAVSLVASIAAWLSGADVLWLLGGVLIGLVIPYTLIVILPTNKRLTDPGLEPGAESTRLLSRWARLHAARSVLGLMAFVVFLIALGRPAGPP